MSSLLTVEQYMALSAAAYGSFGLDDIGKRIGDISYKIPDRDKPQCSSLGSMSGFTLINFTQSSLTGFAAAAFRSPSGEIVFAFRGTENNNGIPVWNDAITDATIGLTILPPTQLQGVQDFVQSTVAKLTNNTNISISDSLQYLRNHNTTATGHSVGGGLAQYMDNLFNKRGVVYA